MCKPTTTSNEDDLGIFLKILETPAVFADPMEEESCNVSPSHHIVDSFPSAQVTHATSVKVAGKGIDGRRTGRCCQCFLRLLVCHKPCLRQNAGKWSNEFSCERNPTSFCRRRKKTPCSSVCHSRSSGLSQGKFYIN